MRASCCLLQLSAHIENVTSIASTIPSVTVARQMYYQLLSEVLATMKRGADGSASDRLKMVAAVYSAFPKEISATGIAASLLTMMGKSGGTANLKPTKAERKQLAKHLKHLLHLVAQQLGSSFDACKLIESFLSHVKDDSWTLEDEEDRARLMFHCALLLIPPPPKETSRHPAKSSRKGGALSHSEADTLTSKLSTARKLMLTWFCTEYGPLFGTANKSSSDGIVGAGNPDYHSALGGVNEAINHSRWLKIARCVLFMENSDSRQIQRFVRGSEDIDENDASWFEDKHRIDRCCEFGCDFDDEMMWVVLRSASLDDGGISSEIALTLLEHLFESCSVSRRGSLKITDVMLAWELYSLVIYEPPKTVIMQREAPARGIDAPGSKFEDAVEEDGDFRQSMMSFATEKLDLPP
jgi:hypothetical protein